MQNILILSLSCALFVMLVVIGIIINSMGKKITNITKTLVQQHNLIVKIQSILTTRNTTNTIAEHSEILYQDLLQHLIPIMAAIDTMPRNTNEHPLWRALGGVMDEYSKNPFVLEKLRRAIKLDNNIAHNVNNYITRANRLLQTLTTTDPDGILTTTFTDGLLGQSLTFFSQAQQLAENGN